MFNPYVAPPSESLRPVDGGAGAGGPGGILRRLSELDSDDLLILLLVFLLAREGDQDGIWPLLAAALYILF